MGYCWIRSIHPFLVENRGCRVVVCLVTTLWGAMNCNSFRLIDSQGGSVVRGHAHLFCLSQIGLSGAIRCGSNNNCLNSVATIYNRQIGMCTCHWPCSYNLSCADICAKCIYLALQHAREDCSGVLSHARTGRVQCNNLAVDNNNKDNCVVGKISLCGYVCG